MQTSEYKKSIIAKLKVGDVIGVRSESAIGKAIRFFAGGNVNHSAVYIGEDQFGNNLLMEAGYQVSVQSCNEYILSDKEEIYCCSANGVSDADKQDMVKNAVATYGAGTAYDVIGIFGLAIRFGIQRYWWRLNVFFNWSGKNKAASSSKVWCSELVGLMYANKKFSFTDESVTYLTPDEIFNSKNVTKIV